MFKSRQWVTEGRDECKYTLSVNIITPNIYMMGGPEPLFTHMRPKSASAMAASPGTLAADSIPLPTHPLAHRDSNLWQQWKAFLSCLSGAPTQDHRIVAKRATTVLARS